MCSQSFYQITGEILYGIDLNVGICMNDPGDYSGKNVFTGNIGNAYLYCVTRDRRGLFEFKQ